MGAASARPLPTLRASGKGREVPAREGAVRMINGRAAVLLEEIENFRRFHPDVLDRLGIQIEVRFQDDSE